jgi:hypothetical protein
MEISTKSSLVIKQCRNEIEKLIKESTDSTEKLVSIMNSLDGVIQEFPKNLEICMLCKSQD